MNPPPPLPLPPPGLIGLKRKNQVILIRTTDGEKRYYLAVKNFLLYLKE